MLFLVILDVFSSFHTVCFIVLFLSIICLFLASFPRSVFFSRTANFAAVDAGDTARAEQGARHAAEPVREGRHFTRVASGPAGSTLHRPLAIPSPFLEALIEPRR